VTVRRSAGLSSSMPSNAIDVLQVAVSRDGRAHLLGEPIVLLADNVGSSRTDPDLSGSMAGYMASAAMALESTTEPSKWVEQGRHGRIGEIVGRARRRPGSRKQPRRGRRRSAPPRFRDLGG